MGIFSGHSVLFSLQLSLVELQCQDCTSRHAWFHQLPYLVWNVLKSSWYCTNNQFINYIKGRLRCCTESHDCSFSLNGRTACTQSYLYAKMVIMIMLSHSMHINCSTVQSFMSIFPYTAKTTTTRSSAWWRWVPNAPARNAAFSDKPSHHLAT